MHIKTLVFNGDGESIKIPENLKLREHPAKYSNSLIPIMAGLLKGKDNVLDVFAGTCKIYKIRDFGYDGKIICNEIEPEWAYCGLGKVDELYIGDAKNLNWAQDRSIQAVCTSCVYGNRISDNYLARDASRRYTYRQQLGRPPSKESSSIMQWGPAYRNFHISAWKEVHRVLEPEGLFILNCSNHIRKGVEQLVTEWHLEAVCGIGFELDDWLEVETKRMGFGANRNLRTLSESILIFRKE